MRRREFITLLGGATASGALPARAQPSHIPRVGIVWIAPQSVVGPFHDAFREGLRELGYVEGQSIVLEARFAQGKLEFLPELPKSWCVPRSMCSWRQPLPSFNR